VTTETDLFVGLSVGFELFQGPFFERPAATKATAISPSQTICLQLIAALSEPDTSVTQVERLVAADPGLGVRILGTVNSAAGAGRHITSMRQAIVLLGRRSLSAWVMLAALGGNPEGRRQDMIDVLTRARTCELMTSMLIGIEASSAYAVGLMSGVVEVMGVDPARIALATRLDEEMTAALVHRRGQVGALLAAIERFERTGQAEPISSGSAPASVIMTAQVSRAHLHALGAAISTIDAILG
jgi:EAL and modified HD-GYP domain-containing signal transduction protein